MADESPKSEIPAKERVGKGWQWTAIVLGTILLLLLLGKHIPTLNLGWVLFGFSMFALYMGYKYFILRLKQPNFEEMITLAKKEASKRNIILNDSEPNCYGEPIGDLHTIRFAHPGVTYLFKGNVLVGRSILTIQELKRDYTRSRLLEGYAKRGEHVEEIL